MKAHFISLVAMLSIGAGSLCAQFGGPPRKPGDPSSTAKGSDVRPTVRNVAQKPSVKGTPTPKSPTPTPGVPTKPQVGKVAPTIQKTAPATPVTPPGTALSGGRIRAPISPTQPIPASPSIVVRKPGVVALPRDPKVAPGRSIRFDLGLVRSTLSTAPRRVAPPLTVRPPAPLLRPGTPPYPIRVYDRTRSVVLVSVDGGQSSELPYISVPLLFTAGTADLLDQTTVDDLQSLASALLELYAQNQNVRFVIEGHTSTDGEAADNLDLSTKRASRVYASLVSRYGVPAAILSIKGYGETYADYRDGTEEQMQLDRRVLVVRTQ